MGRKGRDAQILFLVIDIHQKGALVSGGTPKIDFHSNSRIVRDRLSVSNGISVPVKDAGSWMEEEEDGRNDEEANK